MSTITCNFGVGSMSIRLCSADHGYDSHDMLGGPRILELQETMPRESRRPHILQVLPEAWDCQRFSLTLSRKSATSGASSSRCDCLPAGSTIWVHSQWRLPRTLAIAAAARPHRQYRKVNRTGVGLVSISGGDQVPRVAGAPNPTVLRTIWAPIGPEHQLVQCDWRDTKTTLQPIRAGVGPVYVILVSAVGLSS
jgi:hypothetical protein